MGSVRIFVSVLFKIPLNQALCEDYRKILTLPTQVLLQNEYKYASIVSYVLHLLQVTLPILYLFT